MNTNIISKIEALLSKTTQNGATENEAQEAMLMAQKLMAKYNIDLKEVGQEKTPKVQEVWTKGGQNCSWKRALGQIIAKNFRCRMMVGKTWGLVFIGLEEDTEICIKVFNFAADTLDKNMKKLRKQYRKQGLPTDGISGDYCDGFLAGLNAKFKEQVEKNDWGLVLVTDQAVLDYCKEISDGKASKGHSLNRSGNLGLFNQGYQDGKSLADPQASLPA